MTFTRAFIDAMKYWAPLCGLGYVQGWKPAERSKVLGPEKAIGLPNEVPDGEASSRVPAHDPWPGRHCLPTLVGRQGRCPMTGSAGGVQAPEGATDGTLAWASVLSLGPSD
jgi:hypothetical protein